jgi:hypothetical protein
VILQIVDGFDQSRVCVGLVQGEVDLVVVMLEIVLEGEAGVVFILVVPPNEVDAAECDLVACLEPALPFPLPPPPREDGDEHALSEEGGLLDEIDQSEPPHPSLANTAPVEEPVVVSIGIDIIFNEQIVLKRLLIADVRPADVAVLEI